MVNASDEPDDTAAILGRLRGRIIDMDSHLEPPVSAWGAVYGPNLGAHGQQFVGSHYDCVNGAVPLERVFDEKTPCAPGMLSVADRLAVIDLVGIDRQVLFPPPLVMPAIWNSHDPDRVVESEYNDAMVRWTHESDSRLVGLGVARGRTPDELVSTVVSLCERRVGGFFMRDGVPPGGVSPASAELDDMWSALEESRTPVFLHIGGGQAHLDPAWVDSERMRPLGSGTTADQLISPFKLMSLHLPAVHFLTVLMGGGVFERHPQLRLSLSEVGAMWIGPFAELLDNRAEMSHVLGDRSERPSDTIRRCVRTSPFEGEPLSDMIDRYDMAECYTFSTDIPHLEGGSDPLGRHVRQLVGQPFDVIEKVFVTNGADMLRPRQATAGRVLS